MKKHPGGRPRDERRQVWRDKYALTERQARRLSLSMVQQLETCKDEESQRVLLGIGRVE